jgi:hypothetical protein
MGNSSFSMDKSPKKWPFSIAMVLLGEPAAADPLPSLAHLRLQLLRPTRWGTVGPPGFTVDEGRQEIPRNPIDFMAKTCKNRSFRQICSVSRSSEPWKFKWNWGGTLGRFQLICADTCRYCCRGDIPTCGLFDHGILPTAPKHIHQDATANPCE